MSFQYVNILKELTRRRGVVKPLNERVDRLRKFVVESEVKLSVERARLITEFYKRGLGRGKSVPVQRALAFKYLMENVSLPVEPGQLIVGIRGTGVNEAPTYPEITLHSLEDLKILNEREVMPYRVDNEIICVYESEIIPFWKGRTIREIIFENMDEKWKHAYEAGIWTEFMEQRAPGHTAGGERVFKMGVLDIKKEIRETISQLDPSDPEYREKIEELKAMDIVADGILIYAKR
ncbi:MAG: formate C-acetyltransferase/glycerol dehydratase family glycyl radical enzyme, partial [Crenarchaeota archaeon]|nr:formate C-acetyltransferase/glycerol dehydratase family glycyl radical enzyme [Thermoproteota archaeon]